MASIRRLDIQSKIILVLVGVIVPTFLVVTIIQYHFTQPILEQEWKRIGISTAEALALKSTSKKWLTRPNTTAAIETEIQIQLYLQPSLMRLDVWSRDASTGKLSLLATNLEEDPSAPSTPPELVDRIQSEFRFDDDNRGYWDILYPIFSSGVGGKPSEKVLGIINVQISTKSVNYLMEKQWQISAVAAGVSVVVLILSLNFFLSKAVSNERLLRQAESQNLQLSQRLHETERQLMNVEKFAVMGQLTANFAHEIGTPLNAVGGHLQLLKDELEEVGLARRPAERMEIISGELQRIEEIVKGFLQTAAKPTSQKQLVDLNGLCRRTIEIVRPRIDDLSIAIALDLDSKLGPLRAVPLDFEQILINLLNNSMDSMEEKIQKNEKSKRELTIETRLTRKSNLEYALIAVSDTGLGIAKNDLQNVTKPFFTTKKPGEGTGLGLAICKQLAAKYGGEIELDSKEGSWTRVTLKIPYQANR